MTEKHVRARVVLHGRVQGVFFRVNTLRSAERFGVTGWVKNQPDGTVAAVFEGSEADVDAVLAWCKTGDPPARVDRVDVVREPYSGTYGRFEITR